MRSSPLVVPPGDEPSSAVSVDVVVPVYNEAKVLEGNIDALRSHLCGHFPFTWRLTIADSASTDETWRLAEAITGRCCDVRAIRVDEGGRGAAVCAAWETSDAAVLVYMDVDLSTGLDALLPLVAPLISGHSDLAVGSRLAPGARVARGPRRETLSLVYNGILWAVFATGVQDAQCGFKAVRAPVARRLLPAVKNRDWFFDTELLLLAERNGLRVLELPVDWVDDPDSRVRVVPTTLQDLRGVVRMAWRFATGRGGVDLGDARPPVLPDDHGRWTVAVALTGVVGLVVLAGLFATLRSVLGPFAADAIAVTVTLALGARLRGPAWTGAADARRRARHAWGAWLGLLAVSGAAVELAVGIGAGLAGELAALASTWIAAVVAASLRWKSRRSAAARWRRGAADTAGPSIEHSKR